jgi:hypothetical protein
MEPIIVILLLFGAFTLGTESTGSKPAEATETISEQQQQVAEGRATALSLQRCLSGRHSIIYRDLTLPFARQQIALPAPHESGCIDE